MGLKKVVYRFLGGSRGWLGDSPLVHLDLSKIKQLGFYPNVGIEEGLRRTARYLLDNIWLLDMRKMK